MKLVLILMAAGLAFAQEKPSTERTSLSTAEKDEMLKLLGAYDDLVESNKQLADKISKTELGKRQIKVQEDITKQTKLVKDFVEKKSTEHNAKGCGFSQSFQWTNCPEPPATAPESKQEPPKAK
jgi:hypothetical protein